ncbi:hypothetical protein VTO73DRAFT_15280 [Trametes versicolor]
MPSTRVWLITGASSGFGRNLCDIVLKNGDIVVAAARRTHMLDDLVAQYSHSRVLAVKRDVIQPQSVSETFARAKDAFGRIDVDADARALFDTNFWGAVSVTREAVKFFRESNRPGAGGRLLQMTSVYGIAGVPCSAFYSASKHALEGFTKSIVKELVPAWNIKITLLEPGSFQTEINMMVDATAPGISHIFATKRYAGGLGLVQPPLHFLLGTDAIPKIKSELAELGNDLASYESWSDDVGLTPGEGSAPETI